MSTTCTFQNSCSDVNKTRPTPGTRDHDRDHAFSVSPSIQSLRMRLLNQRTGFVLLVVIYDVIINLK